MQESQGVGKWYNVESGKQHLRMLMCIYNDTHHSVHSSSLARNRDLPAVLKCHSSLPEPSLFHVTVAYSDTTRQQFAFKIPLFLASVILFFILCCFLFLCFPPLNVGIFQYSSFITFNILHYLRGSLNLLL